jgi:hypothetical protein
MSRYAQIKDDFFCDPDFKFPDPVIKVRVRYFYLFYAITSKNLIGLYLADEEVDRVSMGYSEEDFENCKGILINKNKLLWEDSWIWIVGKAKKVQGGKQLASAYKILREIPDGLKLKRKFLDKYKYPTDRVSMGDTYPINGVSLPIPIPIPIPIPKEKEHEDGLRPKLSTPVEKTNFEVRGGDLKTLASVLNLPQPLDEKKIVQDLVLFWNKSFPSSQIGNGDGRWGVFFNILRGEKGYESGIDQEKIKGSILNTVTDNSKSPLNDPFVRFCDRVNNRYKYED